MSNLYGNLKLDHHTGDKWFTHVPKYHKENLLLSRKILMLIIPSLVYRYDSKKWSKATSPIRYSKQESQWAETP